jgi:hypothetical protein
MMQPGETLIDTKKLPARVFCSLKRPGREEEKNGPMETVGGPVSLTSLKHFFMRDTSLKFVLVIQDNPIKADEQAQYGKDDSNYLGDSHSSSNPVKKMDSCIKEEYVAVWNVSTLPSRFCGVKVWINVESRGVIMPPAIYMIKTNIAPNKSCPDKIKKRIKAP